MQATNPNTVLLEPSVGSSATMYEPQQPHRLESLKELHKLLFDSKLPPVLAAIDFEGFRSGQSIDGLGPQTNTHAGVAILQIEQLDIKSLRQGQSPIRTWNIAAGSESHLKDMARQSPWVTPKQIVMRVILKKIKICTPKHRNVIIIGHNCQNDFSELTALGFEVGIPIVGIFDTAAIARPNPRQITLQRLLLDVGCAISSSNFFNAADKANLVLRAFILLSINTLEIGIVEQPKNLHEYGVEMLRIAALVGLVLESPTRRQKKMMANPGLPMAWKQYAHKTLGKQVEVRSPAIASSEAFAARNTR